MKKLLAWVITFSVLFTGLIAYTYAADKKVSVEAKKIEKQEQDLDIKIIYPYLSGFKAAEDINNSIQKRIINSIGNIRNAQGYIMDYKEEQKKSGLDVSHLSVSLESYFDYNTSGNLISVLINSYDYTGGAHGMSYLESYTVNTETNEIYKDFNSLFNNKTNYKKVILDKIYKLIDKEKDLYFDDAKKTVAAKNSNYSFYIDGNKLVIYFDIYELRPYAGGRPIFEIDAKDLKGLLKDNIFKQMVNSKPLERVRFNGTTLKPQFKTYEQNYTLMVPLQDIAKLLGYKVSWDAKKGWAVDGGFVKNKVNSYSSSKSGGVVKVAQPPKAIGNIMYVPIDYFSTVLKEDIFYYGDALRIYQIDQTKKNNMFDEQITGFISPDSADKAVNMYAKAVKERKGAVQYALFSDTLKKAKKATFEELNWVTGVSSPWVTDYQIKKTGTNSYDIIFHWATSSGKADDSIVKVKADKTAGQDYWQITEVKD